MVGSQDVSQEILSQFTTQRDGLLYRRFQDRSFQDNHPNAIWFFRAFQYVNTNFLQQGHNAQTGQYSQETILHARSMMTDYLVRQFSIVTYALDLDFLVALSAEAQEQRNAEGLMICLLPSKKQFLQHESEILLAFAKEDEKTLCLERVHAVRKQLDLAKDGGLAVAYDAVSHSLRTVGILDKKAGSRYPCVHFTRRLEWMLSLPSKTEEISCRLRYAQGTIMMPLLDMQKEQEEEIRTLLHTMGCADAANVAHTIAALLPAIGGCDHGAIVIFLEEETARKEAKRLSSMGRSLLLPKKKSLLSHGNPDQALIKRMASVDGAILADLGGCCYAYGVILDGIAYNSHSANKDRGARYNSTNTYLDSFIHRSASSGEMNGNEPVRIGIVRSEDGMLDVFPKR